MIETIRRAPTRLGEVTAHPAAFALVLIYAGSGLLSAEKLWIGVENKKRPTAQHERSPQADKFKQRRDKSRRNALIELTFLFARSAAKASEGD